LNLKIIVVKPHPQPPLLLRGELLELKSPSQKERGLGVRFFANQLIGNKCLMFRLIPKE
jgi:hypothetical protein